MFARATRVFTRQGGNRACSLPSGFLLRAATGAGRREDLGFRVPAPLSVSFLSTTSGAGGGDGKDSGGSAGGSGKEVKKEEKEEEKKSTMQLVKEYGTLGVAFYMTMVIVPFGGFIGMYYTFDNFGLDPIALFDKFGATETRLGLWERLGLEPDARPSTFQTALVLGWASNQVFEVVRLPFVLWMLPKLRRRFYPTEAEKDEKKAQ